MKTTIEQTLLSVIAKSSFIALMMTTSAWSGGSTSSAESGRKPAKPVASSRAELNSRANQMATGIRAADAALTPAELAIAQHVEVGKVACELGVTVDVKADARSPGYFDVQGKRFKFRMTPVVTGTGAIRLEDSRAGAVWLQLSNKSMLMNQKLGSRMADACMSPAQTAVALAMERNPPASLLESPAVVNQANGSNPVQALPPSIAIQ